MRFTKMHGAGNDYVYVDCFQQSAPDEPDQLADLARRIADRHFGVGGDGLILIGPSQIADARMRMFNADGSEAEMCGNGIRCVAKYVHDHGIARQQTLRIETAAGVLPVEVQTEDDRVRTVRVDMGEPILDAARIPVRFPSGESYDQVVNVHLEKLTRLPMPLDWVDRSGLDLYVTAVSMGNPHLVLYCQDVAEVPLETVGPEWETLPAFPQRTNVHFVQRHHRGEVTIRTWERGSGITLACGTGASAVCVAGVLTDRTDRGILAHLPGGDLQLHWNESDNHVSMTGPAVEVFSGEWYPEGK